jgi:hypothetical protein
MCQFSTPLRAGDTVTAAAEPLAFPGLAVILEVRPAGQAELDNGHLLPLAALCWVDTGERWCAVAGYEDRYRLSCQGKVVSLCYQNTARQRLLQVTGRQRYPSVSLSAGFGPRQVGLNRLVAQHFLPPPTEARFRVLMPKDGNHLNIWATNLQWVDPQELHDPVVVHYLHYCGERHPLHKLSHADVVHVRELLAQGVSQQAIAERFGVSRPAISYLASGRSYRRG